MSVDRRSSARLPAAASAALLLIAGCGAAAPATATPGGPVRLQVAETTGSMVALAWSAAGAADGYAVWRGDASGQAAAQVASLPAALLVFQDRTVRAGETYTFSVRALDASGAASAASNTVVATAVSGAASGPFKQALPASPVAHPDSAALVRALLAEPPVVTAEFGTSVYTANDTDPLCTITFTKAGAWGVPWTEAIRIPAGAQATGGGSRDPLGDHWLSVRSGGAQYDIWYFDTWNGTPCGADGRGVAAHGARYAFPGPLLRPAPGGSGSGSGISVAAGAPTRTEIATDGIDHALNLVVAFEAATFVPPAWKADGDCAGAGCAPAGQRYFLAATDAELAAIAHPGQRALAHALRTYGAYVTDRTARTNIPIEKAALDLFAHDFYALDQIPWARLTALKCADGSGTCVE